MAIDGYQSNKKKMIGIILPEVSSKESKLLVGSQRKILLSNGEITWMNLWELETIGWP